MTDFETTVISLIQEQNELIRGLVTLLNEGTGKAAPAPRTAKIRLSEEEMLSLDEEINLDWWFHTYGEEPLPAKYMCVSLGTPAPGENHYRKEEGDYIFSRLKDFLEEENSEGTHVFKYLDKVWCPREKQARNCFGFVPVKGRKFNVES